MRRRPSRASANATRHESHLTSAESPRPRPYVARNVSARWRRRCPSRARRRRTMPPPRTRASPPAPSRIAACTAPLLAFEGLAGEASLASCRPSSSARRRGRGPCGGVLCATWCLARRQTYAGPALSALPPCGHVALHARTQGCRQRTTRASAVFRFCSPAAVMRCTFTKTCAWVSSGWLSQHLRVPPAMLPISRSLLLGTNALKSGAPLRVCPARCVLSCQHSPVVAFSSPNSTGKRSETPSRAERMHRCTPRSSLCFSR